MANTNRSKGLTPIRHLSGSPWNGQISMYYHSTAQTSALYKGDLVYSDAGLDSPTCGPDPLGVYQSIMKAPDDSSTLLGVAWTFGSTPQVSLQSTNLNAANYCPASTGMYIGVIDDPSVIYEIQASNATWVSSNIGDNCDTTNNTTGGVTATGRSTSMADHGTITSGTASLRVLRMVNRPDNEIGAYCKLEVMIAENVMRGTMTAYATT